MIKLFSIGEFAKLHSISKQTLIHYDKIGLLSPIYKDENTGYRYYGATQLELLDTIFILKEIGVPLSSIKEFLSQRTAKKTVQMLKEQRENLDKQISHLAKVRKRLDKRIDTLESSVDIKGYTNIKYEKQDKKIIYYENVDEPKTLLEVNIAIKKLLQNLTLQNIEYNYLIGSSISYEDLISGDFSKTYRAFSFLDKKIRHKNCVVVNYDMYATIYHLGNYHNQIGTYEMLTKKIKDDGYTIIGSSIEECIVDNLVVLNEYDYLTKISIPVKKLEDYENIY